MNPRIRPQDSQHTWRHWWRGDQVHTLCTLTALLQKLVKVFHIGRENMIGFHQRCIDCMSLHCMLCMKCHPSTSLLLCTVCRKSIPLLRTRHVHTVCRNQPLLRLRICLLHTARIGPSRHENICQLHSQNIQNCHMPQFQQMTVFQLHRNCNWTGSTGWCIFQDHTAHIHPTQEVSISH